MMESALNLNKVDKLEWFSRAERKLARNRNHSHIPSKHERLRENSQKSYIAPLSLSLNKYVGLTDDSSAEKKWLRIAHLCHSRLLRWAHGLHYEKEYPFTGCRRSFWADSFVVQCSSLYMPQMGHLLRLHSPVPPGRFF